MIYTRTLRVDYDTRKKIDDWCKANCQGSWKCTSFRKNYGPVPPTWRFTEERDYLMFLLRWK